jgi:hypothetical protein
MGSFKAKKLPTLAVGFWPNHGQKIVRIESNEAFNRVDLSGKQASFRNFTEICELVTTTPLTETSPVVPFEWNT